MSSTRAFLIHVTRVVLVNLDGVSSSRTILIFQTYNVTHITFLWGKGGKHERKLIKRIFWVNKKNSWVFLGWVSFVRGVNIIYPTFLTSELLGRIPYWIHYNSLDLAANLTEQLLYLAVEIRAIQTNIVLKYSLY